MPIPDARQDTGEGPGELGFHPLRSPGCFLRDNGPQLKEALLSPGARGAQCKQPSPQKGKYVGHTLPQPTAPARAGMQDTTQSEVHGPLPLCSSSHAPKWEDSCKIPRHHWCWRRRCRLSQSRGGKVRAAAGQLFKSQHPYR